MSPEILGVLNMGFIARGNVKMHREIRIFFMVHLPRALQK